MTALGIIGCQVLEDEIAYVISSDPEVRKVIIFDQTEERSLSSKILGQDKGVEAYGHGFRKDLLRESDGFTIIVSLKPISLHQSPSMLREDVLDTIELMNRVVDSILIFYGQCGNAFLNLETMVERTNVPLTILSDRSGCPVDDCFGTALGGREEYREFLLRTPGPAFLVNPMWAANWRHFMQEVQMMRDPNDIEEVRTVFQYMDYRCIVGLDTGIIPHPSFETDLSELGQIFGLEHKCVQCGNHVVEHSYQKAKSMM